MVYPYEHHLKNVIANIFGQVNKKDKKVPKRSFFCKQKQDLCDKVKIAVTI
jgi:hypothetical protein